MANIFGSFLTSTATDFGKRTILSDAIALYFQISDKMITERVLEQGYDLVKHLLKPSFAYVNVGVVQGIQSALRFKFPSVFITAVFADDWSSRNLLTKAVSSDC